MNAATPAAPQTDTNGLIDLIDRLETLLNESELSEIEVEAGGTTVLLRKPAALPADGSAALAQPSAGAAAASPSAQSDGPSPNAVIAPLTGLFYTSPSPGAEPYLNIGGQVMVGQVIGLSAAMTLFNEIKSDRAGRVTRIYVESGALVKAKQPLIEVEP
jgi:acetyl-CoA carboxylase biotin carboxyl carrier protein